MSVALRRLFLASLARRRLATTLSLLAIALGVALGLAVQLIHSAALDEFGRGMRELSGEADLQVLGPRSGFDDALFVALAQRAEIAEASPMLETTVAVAGREEPLRIVAVDVFRAARMQAALRPQVDDDVEEGALAALAEDAVFLSPSARVTFGARVDGRLKILTARGERTLRVLGGVPGAGGGQVLAVMDIAAAQQLFDRIGRITRIDLRLAAGVGREEAKRQLQALLPAGVQLLEPELGETQAASLSRAYRVNLTMLAAIALLTGGFLVFSTQLLSVVRRRQEFAFLRALGLERGALLRGLLAEGGVLGFVGGVAGAALAYVLAGLAFKWVGGDLGAGYFEGVRPALRFDAPATLVYLLLGTGAGIAGAWLPAREAMRLSPARGLRAGDEAEVFQARTRWGAAVACLAVATLSCLVPPVFGVPLFGYLAVALVLAGAVLALPGATRGAMRALGHARPLLFRLAHARLAAAPGQVVVAGAGVVASVALASAMAIMVASFRGSVDDWLLRLLPADLYVQAGSGAPGALFDRGVPERIRAVKGVATVAATRFETLRLDPRRPPVTLIAREVEGGRRLPLVEEGGSGGASALPPAWISEAMVDLYGMAPGQTLVLPISGREEGFRIAGVWRDYVRQHGAVVVELADYRRLSGDAQSSELALRLAPGADVDAVERGVRAALGARPARLGSAAELRARSLAIFDRTFLVTYLMEAVAVLIGLFGVATSFAALATARRKEFGMLRHLGLTRGEIGRLLALEGALAAAIGVGAGLAAGGGIAWILVEVVNRQSFHWSMDIDVPFGGLAAFSLVLVSLAALAARLAGRRAMHGSVVLAVKEDW